MKQNVEQELPVIQTRLALCDARVAVVGLGYVGLPLALAFCRRSGLSAVGIDIDPARASAISEGRSYIQHVDALSLSDAVREGRLEASTDFARVRDCDAIIICVPTPLTPQRERTSPSSSGPPPPSPRTSGPGSSSCSSPPATPARPTRW